ncbi:hypothetical protein NC652_000701 [Populus alba x Populus x berolinensis]|nr:hypothetical protein NC652_000701 [Populus alba x Populus x berolinensis]
MGIFLDVLPACRKNCPGPIKQGHLHLQIVTGLEDPFSSGRRTSQKAWFYGFFDRPWP